MLFHGIFAIMNILKTVGAQLTADVKTHQKLFLEERGFLEEKEVALLGEDKIILQKMA